MNISRRVLVSVGAAVAITVAASGVTSLVTAGANDTSTTYYGCLTKAGTLNHVATSAPTCTAKGSTAISWNSVGPQGTPGVTGPTGANGAVGPQGSPGTNGVTYDCSASPYSGIDLANCTLQHETWAFVKLIGADLATTDFRFSTITSSYFNGANLSFAELDGVDLWGSNMPAANLTGASLAGTNLAGTNLTDANLTGANLTGATVTGAVFTSATWSGTTCPDSTNSDNDGGTCVNNLAGG